MSSVRMCDDCKEIFSENSEDWMSSPGAIHKRNPMTGKVEQIPLQLDTCGVCVRRKAEAYGNNGDRPRVPAVEGRYSERYTRQLEREAGIDVKDGMEQS